jgi:hypothetical protein
MPPVFGVSHWDIVVCALMGAHGRLLQTVLGRGERRVWEREAAYLFYASLGALETHFDGPMLMMSQTLMCYSARWNAGPGKTLPWASEPKPEGLQLTHCSIQLCTFTATI